VGWIQLQNKDGMCYDIVIKVSVHKMPEHYPEMRQKITVQFQSYPLNISLKVEGNRDLHIPLCCKAAGR